MISQDAIRQLHDQGLSDNQIAKQLGYSHTYVGRVRSRMGLQANGKGGAKDQLSRAQFGQVLQLHRRGWINIDIAREVGCHYSTITYILGQLGLRRNEADIAQRRRRSRSQTAIPDASELINN